MTVTIFYLVKIISKMSRRLAIDSDLKKDLVDSVNHANANSP